VPVVKEPFNINAVIDSYLTSPEHKKLMQYHPEVTVAVNLDPRLLNIQGSPTHMRKVIMNLVSNASEAIEEQGIVVLSTTNRYIDRPLKGYETIDVGEYVVLTVADNGQGISDEDLGHIFEPFYTKKVMGRSGTGLGLTVVWNVVLDHNGYIDVSSDERGAKFELYFPATREEAMPIKPPLPFENLQGKHETILVIDDEKTQREISCRMLEALGYKTAAVEYLKHNRADLLLLDMIMEPGIGGRETYERIGKIHPGQKAVIVSGFAETEMVEETQKMGAGRYLKKPLLLEELAIAVKEELAK
jgi:CheY-like chemotaxis protein